VVDEGLVLVRVLIVGKSTETMIDLLTGNIVDVDRPHGHTDGLRGCYNSEHRVITGVNSDPELSTSLAHDAESEALAPEARIQALYLLPH
jgi:hypothetical protein